MKLIPLLFLTIAIFFAGSFGPVAAQIPAPDHESIRWMSFTDAVRENARQPKKIFIDVYTKWCGWCKRMDATTYEDAGIAKYMNENFYAVRLDAETRDT